MKKSVLTLLPFLLCSLFTKAQFQDGQRVQATGEQYVYLIMHNQKRLIADPKAYSNFYENWNGITKITIAQLNAIPTGKTITEASYLAKSSTSVNVYFVDEGKCKRFIPNPAVYNKYGFSWKKIKIKEDVINIPKGDYDLQ